MSSGVDHTQYDGPARPADGAAPQRESRPSRLFACDMRLANGRVTKIRVRNISSGGLGARADVTIDAWQRVEVQLPSIGTVEGRVVWVRQGQFGVQFFSPIDPDEVVVTPRSNTRHVVPPQFRPTDDFRRPGFRTR